MKVLLACYSSQYFYISFNVRLFQYPETFCSSLCSNAMSGLSLVSLLQCASLTATLLHLTKVSIQYSVHIQWVSQGTSKRSKFSWILYWQVWCLICTRVLHKCGVAPLFARCHFTVLSNQNSKDREVSQQCASSTLVYVKCTWKFPLCAVDSFSRQMWPQQPSRAWSRKWTHHCGWCFPTLCESVRQSTLCCNHRNHPDENTHALTDNAPQLFNGNLVVLAWTHSKTYTHKNAPLL